MFVSDPGAALTAPAAFTRPRAVRENFGSTISSARCPAARFASGSKLWPLPRSAMVCTGGVASSATGAGAVVTGTAEVAAGPLADGTAASLSLKQAARTTTNRAAGRSARRVRKSADNPPACAQRCHTDHSQRPRSEVGDRPVRDFGRARAAGLVLSGICASTTNSLLHPLQ